jgi:hypothetical protein
MTKMRFEIRQDVTDAVGSFQKALEKNYGESFTVGYMNQTMVELIMDLPPAKRKARLEMMNNYLNHRARYDQAA